MSCDGYWFEDDAPTSVNPDQGPTTFAVNTGAEPLYFRFYIPRGHPSGVVVRATEFGHDFSERLQEQYLKYACRWAETYFEAEALANQLEKYREKQYGWPYAHQAVSRHRRGMGRPAITEPTAEKGL